MSLHSMSTRYLNVLIYLFSETPSAVTTITADGNNTITIILHTNEQKLDVDKYLPYSTLSVESYVQYVSLHTMHNSNN